MVAGYCGIDFPTVPLGAASKDVGKLVVILAQQVFRDFSVAEGLGLTIAQHLPKAFADLSEIMKSRTERESVSPWVVPRQLLGDSGDVEHVIDCRVRRHTRQRRTLTRPVE